jgi:hypothetical protein
MNRHTDGQNLETQREKQEVQLGQLKRKQFGQTILKIEL